MVFELPGEGVENDPFEFYCSGERSQKQNLNIEGLEILSQIFWDANANEPESLNFLKDLRIKEEIEEKPALTSIRFSNIMLHQELRKGLVLGILLLHFAVVP